MDKYLFYPVREPTYQKYYKNNNFNLYTIV